MGIGDVTSVPAGQPVPESGPGITVRPEPPIPGQWETFQPHGVVDTTIEALSRGTRHSGDSTEFIVDKAFDPKYSIPVGVAGGGVSAIMAIRKLQQARSPLTMGNVATGTFEALGTNSMRLTPTLVSAVAGPALADIASYVAPNLVPKYKSVTVNNPREAPRGASSNKGEVQFMRAAVGGATVGVLAGLAFLLKPSLFQRANFITEEARTGINAVTGIKTGAPMVKDAVFSHRLALGLVGGGAAAYLGQRAIGTDADTRRTLLVGAAGTLAATAVGLKAMPYVTRGSARATGLAFLPDTGMFWKPNLTWFKNYASRVAPFTAVPAGSAAYTYLDTFNDFGKITDPRSQYRD